jgi:virginiamycin B lyase
VSNFTNPIIDEPQGITSGPDGALWFTNDSLMRRHVTDDDGSIGRMTTSGEVSDYKNTKAAPDVIESPRSIIVGPEGALWFVNGGNSSIGRITVSGSRSDYTGYGIVAPTDLTAGPDGAIWFTTGNDGIGRLAIP